LAGCALNLVGFGAVMLGLLCLLVLVGSLRIKKKMKKKNENEKRKKMRGLLPPL
jgi:hypothetical protein